MKIRNKELEIRNEKVGFVGSSMLINGLAGIDLAPWGLNVGR